MTTLHPAAAYWDQGVVNVPVMTGAASLLDAEDVRSICADLSIQLPFASVLDVGCGTGRVAPLCSHYVGCDIAPSCVDYCRMRSLDVDLTTDPHDLRTGPFSFVVCLSVFTHIDRFERRAYLTEFTKRAAGLLIDFIPGDGTGDVPKWTACPREFDADLIEAGYASRGTTDRVGPDGVLHRYVIATLVDV